MFRSSLFISNERGKLTISSITTAQPRKESSSQFLSLYNICKWILKYKTNRLAATRPPIWLVTPRWPPMLCLKNTIIFFKVWVMVPAHCVLKQYVMLNSWCASELTTVCRWQRIQKISSNTMESSFRPSGRMTDGMARQGKTKYKIEISKLDYTRPTAKPINISNTSISAANWNPFLCTSSVLTTSKRLIL